MRTLGVVLTIVIATLTWASGAVASSYKILHVFERAKYPVGNLTWDAAGNLYGTTVYGGPRGLGVVFKLKPNPDGTWTTSILHSFTGADGDTPSAGLIFDAAGNLYGTTVYGGPNAFGGVVFKLKPNPDGTWTESVLHGFTAGADGLEPSAGLIFDLAGNLYGTTEEGGDLTCNLGYGCGVVFKLKPNPDGTWTEKVLHAFTGADGADPLGGGRCSTRRAISMARPIAAANTMKASCSK